MTKIPKADQGLVTPAKTYARAIAEEAKKRTSYSNREVGITHPDNPGYIRITDNGDIEIMASPGVGIIISGLNKSISIHADEVKVFTKKKDGLRWNDLSFNSAAYKFSEPTFISTTSNAFNPAYNNIYEYLNDVEYQLNFNKPNLELENFNSSETGSPFDGLTSTQSAYFVNHLKDFSAVHVNYEIKLVKDGYSLDLAHEKAIADKGE